MNQSDHMQALVRGLSIAQQSIRAAEQMTLGELIRALEGTRPDLKIVGFGRPRSYRGYYEDLAFEPVEQTQTAAELLEVAKGCMGRTFQGWKGGDYVMHENTPLWIAEWGDPGMRILGLETRGDDEKLIYPVLAAEEE